MGKKLAIKGHSTRGKEVIKLLEMMGGKNTYGYTGDMESLYFSIYNDTIIYGSDKSFLNDNYVFFTLEEFLERFPFKVGDRVNSPCIGCVKTITSMKWDDYLDTVSYKLDNKIYTRIEQLKVDNDIEYMGKNIFGYKPDDIVFVDEINWVKITNKFWNSYKKEFFYKGVGLLNQKVYDNISHKNIRAEMLLPIFNVNNNNEDNSIDRNVNDICDDILINQVTAKVAIINLKSDVCDDEVELNLGDYEIEIRDNKTYAVLKKPKYPKTHEECCKILGIDTQFGKRYLPPNTISYDDIRLSNFQDLLICRTAYWEIAGKEMGIGKRWIPDWSTEDDIKYVIEVYRNNVRKNSLGYSNTILAFPTKEMRDAFYENFKDLIESCKEWL